LDDPLIWVRAVHFASTILVSGVVFFLVFIGEPAFRKAGGNGHVASTVRPRLSRLAWIGLTCVLISGVAWLSLQAARMADRPLAETFSDATLWTVITQTDFGRDWMVRLVLAGLVAAYLLPLQSNRMNKPYWKQLVAVFLAASLVGTLAWAGHAAAGTGLGGTVQLTTDILHLIAAAAWVGALVPLAVLLGAAAHGPDHAPAAIAREAALRFSTLGIASVGTLLATGVVNSWMLVGSVEALVGTDYGRLLMLKIALFLVMLAIAGVNRLLLTPRIVRAKAGAMQLPLRQLRNNSLIEAALGAVILIIVSVLGTLPPGILE
jgi:putative copper resistance protein D